MNSAYRKVEHIIKHGSYNDHANNNQRNNAYLKKIQGKPFAEVLAEENERNNRK